MLVELYSATQNVKGGVTLYQWRTPFDVWLFLLYHTLSW